MTVMASGTYDLARAARLIGEKPSTVRRWAFGYRRRGVDYRGAVATRLPQVENDDAVTFHELIELLFLSGFRASGLSLPKIREAIEVARRLFDSPNPFAMKNWFVDPAGLYAELRSLSGETMLVELSGDAQIAIVKAVRPYLHQLDFDVNDLAERWYPRGRDVPVLLDPTLAMGEPVVAGTAVPTSTLMEFYRGDESIDDLAWWYGLQPGQVAAAVRFEGEIAA